MIWGEPCRRERSVGDGEGYRCSGVAGRYIRRLGYGVPRGAVEREVVHRVVDIHSVVSKVEVRQTVIMNNHEVGDRAL